MFPEDSQPVPKEAAVALAQSGKPLAGTVASTIHESKGLVIQLGWWYLLIFFLIPLISKRGRGWLKKLTDLNNNVSKEELTEKLKEIAEGKGGK